jgi:hypothetical protein
LSAFSGAWAAIVFETAAHAPEKATSGDERSGKVERAAPLVTEIACDEGC